MAFKIFDLLSGAKVKINPDAISHIVERAGKELTVLLKDGKILSCVAKAIKKGK